MMDLSRLLLTQGTGIFVALGKPGEIVHESAEFTALRKSAPGLCTALLAGCKRVLTTGIAETFEIGEKPEYRCSVHPVRETNGELVASAATCIEITELKQTARLFEAVVEGTSEAIFVKDLEGRYLMANSAAAQILGVPKAELLGKTDFDLMPRETAEAFVASDRSVMDSGKVSTYEETGPLGESRLTFQATKGPHFDPHGKIIGVIGIARDITEMKRYREELQRVISLQRAAFESTADGLLVIDPTGRVVDFNQKLLDIWRIPRSELEGRDYLHAMDVVAPLLENPDACRQSLKEALAAPDRETFEVLKFKDGTVLERYSRPQKIEGRTVGRVFSYRDMTDRTRAENSLRESEIRMRTILNSAMDCVISMDGEGRIRGFNTAAEAQFGITAAEAIGKDLADQIIPERYRERHRLGLARYLATREGPVLGRRLELPALRNDGTEFPAEISITAARLSGTPFFTGFIRDITEHRRSVERIAVQAQRLKSLADASRTFAEAHLELRPTLDIAAKVLGEYYGTGCVIRLLGKDGKLELVSSHHKNSRILEFLRESISRGFRLLDEDSLSGVLKAMKPIEIQTSQEELHARVRPEFWSLLDELKLHSWILAPLQVSGQAIGVVTLMREAPAGATSAEEQEFIQNLADRIALAIDNAKLYAQSQDAIRLREDFIVTASHELRTPLTPLKLNLDRLTSLVHARKIAPSPPDPKIAHLLETFESSGKSVSRISRLVDDMLEVAQLGARGLTLVPTPVDFSELVDTVVRGFRHELLEIRSPLELSIEPRIVGRWDRARLEQVVSNLLANAIKFGAGRQIRVELSSSPEGPRLIVRDRGIGIAKEDQSRIFGRFERAVSLQHFGGLGLGLYITRHIVEAHGGRISIESEPGLGTTVIVELPFRAPGEVGRLPAA